MFAKRGRSDTRAAALALRQVDRGDAPAPPADEDRVPSIVAAGMTVQGEVASDGEVHVDGTVEGTVTCAVVTVGRDGKVLGRVRASLIRVHGAVEGELFGERVEVAATGRVTGRVHLRTLEVQAGATFFCETRPVGEMPAVGVAPVPSTLPPSPDED